MDINYDVYNYTCVGFDNVKQYWTQCHVHPWRFTLIRPCAYMWCARRCASATLGNTSASTEHTATSISQPENLCAKAAFWVVLWLSWRSCISNKVMHETVRIYAPGSDPVWWSFRSLTSVWEVRNMGEILGNWTVNFCVLNGALKNKKEEVVLREYLVLDF